MRIERSVGVAILIAGVTVTIDASAQQTRATVPMPMGMSENEVIEVDAPRPTGRLKAGRRRVSRRELVESIADEPIDVGPHRMTVRAYLEQYAHIERRLGRPLSSMPEDETEPGATTGDGVYTPPNPRPTDPNALVPKEAPLGVGFKKSVGSKSTIGGYAKFEVVDRATEKGVGCGAELTVGGYLFDEELEIAKAGIVSEATPTSVGAHAYLNFLGKEVKKDVQLGQSSPLEWSDTARTRELKKDFRFLAGIVTLTVKAQGNASAGVRLSNKSERGQGYFACGVAFEPFASVGVTASASASIGLPGIPILEGGIRGDVKLAEVAVPTTASVRLDQRPALALSESLGSKITLDLLKGELVAFIRVHAPCFLGIPLTPLGCGKKEFKKKLAVNGYHYEKPLLDVSNRKTGYVRNASTGTGGGEAYPSAAPYTCTNDVYRPGRSQGPVTVTLTTSGSASAKQGALRARFSDGHETTQKVTLEGGKAIGVGRTFWTLSAEDGMRCETIVQGGQLTLNNCVKGASLQSFACRQ